MNGLATFLATSSGQTPIGPVIGIVAFFGVIIALSLWSTKNAAKGGAKKIRAQYGDKILEEGVFSKSMHYFFTQDEFLVQKYNVVFASYRLSDIRNLGLRWDATLRQTVLYMTDAEGKRVMPAEVVGGTKAARKMFGNNAVSMSKDEAIKVSALLLKYAPHIQLEEKQ